MNIEITDVFGAIVIGVGATLVLDLWGLFLKRAFNIPAPNFCLVGRWLSYMSRGVFTHASIVAAAQRPAECVIGWIAHYIIGVLFALAFVALATPQWLQSPTLLPALIFGIITIVFPFFIMQPAFGLGFAVSKTPNPMQARLRSLITHLVFGIGLYISALVMSFI
ncbi:MAG TPA: DUF2938 domain-containing protein [Gammaproteobacteria bacterium]